MREPVESALALARDVARRLVAVPGVRAVVLGGSCARGDARPDSDVDLGLLYRASEPPDRATLIQLAREMDPRTPPPQVTEPGAWGPWVNGGAWLEVQGRRVDWLYRDIDRVEAVFEACLAGHTSCDYSLGHPHGFHAHVYLGEIHHAVALSDPHDEVARLKERVATYPPALRREIVRRYLYDARFVLELARKPAARGDVFHVAGCLFRSVAALVQVLFALNEVWFTNEKGAVATADGFALCPGDFGLRARTLLAAPGDAGPSLARSLAAGELLVEDTAALCADAGLPG